MAQSRYARSRLLNDGCKGRPSEGGKALGHAACLLEAQLDQLSGEAPARSNRSAERKISTELVEAIDASEDYAVAGETYSAAYNDPFTPPWRRRNEVLVPVEKIV